MAAIISAGLLMAGLGSWCAALALDLKSFDRAAWDAGRGNNTGSNLRSQQVKVLRESGLVSMGTPRERVRAALGDPENSDGRRDLYSLGLGYGASLEYFVVHYDEQGRVVRTSLVRG